MRRAAVPLAVVVALVAACGGGPEPQASRTPSPSGPSSAVAEIGPAEPPAGSWDDVRGPLEALDADVGMLAARVGDGGTCEPVAEIDPGTPRPLGSVFKLYVLGAVAAAVDAGEIGWDDLLTIDGDVRSLPSGELQDEPDGTRVPVSLAAAEMIDVSDNTAADLLIDLVGRTAVEDAMTTMGHARPGLNQPFLTTREFFTVGWGAQGLRDDWAQAGAAARLRILAALPAGPLRVSGDDIVDPAWESGVDWFGSALDVCAALAALHGGIRVLPGDSPGEVVRSIMGHNRGVTIDPVAWPYVAYKGGSAPGVLTAAWYGERADGERYVFVLQAAATDPGALAGRDAFYALGEQAFRLLAGHQGP